MSQKVSKKGNLLLELRNNINMVIKKIFVNIYIIYKRLRDRVSSYFDNPSSSPLPAT